ncbi:MAG: hypothetical protein V4582_24420 [Pseudomonadota bacterium]
MEHAQRSLAANLRHILHSFSGPASAPEEIYGARALGCQPGDDYLYRGYRYVQDAARDVLVREDMRRRN